MSVAAGWYTDPHQAGHLRWWDGATWTSATQSAAPVYGGQPAYGVAPQPSAVDLVVPPAHTAATRSVIWGAISLLIFFAFPASIMAIVFASIGLAHAARVQAAGGPPVGRSTSMVGLTLGIASLMLFTIVIVVALVL